jgi:tRNA-dihydrouridine synthase B
LATSATALVLKTETPTVSRLSSQVEQPLPARTRSDWSPSIPKIRPLKIGTVEINVPIVQAALSGYSDWPMRVVARRLGAPYTIAEVMIDHFVTDLHASRERTKHFLKVTEEERPVAAQLMGSDPADFVPAAQRLAAAGFDVIDINFGCPVKTAMGGCRGGYHLSQPGVALQIVASVRENLPKEIPLTLKMRRGIDDSENSQQQFFGILDGAFDIGVAAITVHGRTVTQKYDGPSSWDFLAEVKQHAGDHNIIGSGDVFTAQDCLDMLSYTEVDGVSVARGAIGNPWIFAQASKLLAGEEATAPSINEQRRVLSMQMELCKQVYNEKQATTTMRKFGIKFSRWHADHESVRNAFVAARSTEAWQKTLDTWYTNSDST